MCFTKALHLIFIHFYFLYSMFWGLFSKNQVIFLKSCFFQNFDWSNLIFDQSKSFWKISVSLCLVRLIELVFRSIEHRESRFLKNSVLLIQNTFSNFFQTFLSLSLSDLVRPLYPFFCFYFHDFMHKLMHFNGIFGTFQIWSFCWINHLFPEIDHWVLLVYCYIHDLCWKIWSIWDFVRNWKF